MALNLEQKKAIVADLSAVAGNAVSVVAADYCGLTVSEMTKLRVQTRQSGVHMQVYRNTLARRALQGTQFECLQDALTGSIVLFFSQEAPGAAAKLLQGFVKEHDKLEVKALSLGETMLSAEQLDAVASLPSKEQALAQLMSVMLAPTTTLVRTLAETYTMAVRVMGQVRDQKQTG